MLRLLLALILALPTLAADLVPVPVPEIPAVGPGLEPNRGQTNPEFLFLHRGTHNLAIAPTAAVAEDDGEGFGWGRGEVDFDEGGGRGTSAVTQNRPWMVT